MQKYKYFPYKPRDEQIPIVDKVNDFIFNSDKKGLIIQADPGVGKEICMISQALLGLEEKQYNKVIFVVPTDSGKLNKNKELLNIGFTNYIQIYSKDILCNHLKHDTSFNSDDFCAFEFCKLMGHNCEYKINETCDYYIQKQQITNADVIICDYNYILSPYIRKFSGIGELMDQNNTLLLVDESHKLPSRMDNIYSTSISSTTVNRAIQELDKYGFKHEKLIAEKVLDLMIKMADVNRDHLEHQIYDFMLEYGIKTIPSSPFEILSQEKLNLVTIGKKIAMRKFIEKEGVISYTEILGNFLNKCKNNLPYRNHYIYFVKLKHTLDTCYIGWTPYTLSYQIRKVLDNVDRFILYSGTIQPDKFRCVCGLDNGYPVETNTMIESPYLKNRKDMIFSKGNLTADIRTDILTLQEIRQDVIDIVNALPRPLAIISTRSWYKVLELSKNFNILTEPETQDELRNWVDNLYPKNDIIYFSPHGRLAQSIDLKNLRSVLFISYPVSYDEISQKRRDKLIKKMKSTRGNPKFAADYITFTVPTFQAIIQSVMRGLRNDKSKLDVVYFDRRYERFKSELNSKTLTIYKDKSKLIKAITEVI